MKIDILHRPTALENLLAGRTRSLGGPDLARGPYVAHACAVITKHGHHL